jgi:glutathione S-transferase
MYTLYWNHGSASLTAHAALEESGAPYKLHYLNMDKGDHKAPDYLKINPNGKIPALVLDSGPVMFETVAIAMFIADRHPASGLAPVVADPKRALYTQWLVHLTNTVQPLYLLYYYPERATTNPAHAGEIKAKAQEAIGEAWDRIERWLEKNGPYMIGERFSAADLPVLMLTSWREAQPDVLERHPSVRHLVELLSARPAIARVLKENQLAA